MAFCETNKKWDIALLLDRPHSETERLTFDVKIDAQGMITGKVIDSNGDDMSDLTGRCQIMQLPGLPNLSVMNFVFRARHEDRELGVHLSGIAYNANGTPVFDPKFEGRFILFNPDDIMPSSGLGQFQTSVLGDPGDTGTGSGSQT